jgi:hypothetical protein
LSCVPTAPLSPASGRTALFPSSTPRQEPDEPRCIAPDPCRRRQPLHWQCLPVSRSDASRRSVEETERITIGARYRHGRRASFQGTSPGAGSGHSTKRSESAVTAGRSKERSMTIAGSCDAPGCAGRTQIRQGAPTGARRPMAVGRGGQRMRKRPIDCGRWATPEANFLVLRLLAPRTSSCRNSHRIYRPSPGKDKVTSH